MASNNPERWQQRPDWREVHDDNQKRLYRGSEYGHERRAGHSEGNYYGSRNSLSDYNQGSYRRGINPNYGQHSYGDMSSSRHPNPGYWGLEEGRGYGYNREDYQSSEASERRNRHNFGRQGNFGDHGRAPYRGNPYQNAEDRGVESFQNYGEYQQHGPFRGKGPKNYRRSDERISEDINDRLSDDPFIDATEIMAQVSGGEVILIGTVNSRWEKRRAEDLAESVSGVSQVENRLRIKTLEQSSGFSKEKEGPFGKDKTGPVTQTEKADRTKKGG